MHCHAGARSVFTVWMAAASNHTSLLSRMNFSSLYVSDGVSPQRFGTKRVTAGSVNVLLLSLHPSIVKKYGRQGRILLPEICSLSDGLIRMWFTFFLSSEGSCSSLTHSLGIMVPVLDMFNHCHDSEVDWFSDESGVVGFFAEFDCGMACCACGRRGDTVFLDVVRRCACAATTLMTRTFRPVRLIWLSVD